MKKEEIQALFSLFEQVSCVLNDVECWSARDLCTLLGYKLWQNFTKVIDKAKEACINVGQNVEDHFIDVNKMVVIGSGAERQIDDIMLTRQTRAKLQETERKLSGVLYERGVNDKSFAVIRSKGDQALFRLNTATLKRRMGIPEKRPLADFLPTISIKAKDFAAEMTSVNVQTKDLQGESRISQEHIANNAAVRDMLVQRGIVPENLPPAEDVKKVERRLASEQKKALENKKKKQAHPTNPVEGCADANPKTMLPNDT